MASAETPGLFFAVMSSLDVMACPRCGRENPESNQFCGRCGFEFAKISPAVPQNCGDARFCFRHPKEATNLSCGRCEKPFCYKCLAFGPAGPRCKECARHNIPIKPRAVLNDARVGLSRVFRAGPFAIYFWLLIGMMLFGAVRGCVYMSRREPPLPPSQEEFDPGQPPLER